jgi:hypothetical protein
VSPAFVISTGLVKPDAKVCNPMVWALELFKQNNERNNTAIFIIKWIYGSLKFTNKKIENLLNQLFISGLKPFFNR